MNKIIKALIVCSLFLIPLFNFGQEEGGDKAESIEKRMENKKFQEVVILDSMPASEVLKRAVHFIKIESKRFVKTKGVTTANKAECVAKFPIKPKELNPVPDYTGFITMHISIECKDNRYRYIISKITHVSKSGKANGGDVSNNVPECGSMTMPDLVWKKIKGDAFKDASMVISELKDTMLKSADSGNDEW